MMTGVTFNTNGDAIPFTDSIGPWLISFYARFAQGDLYIQPASTSATAILGRTFRIYIITNA